MRLFNATVDSPVGNLHVVTRGTTLLTLAFEEYWAEAERDLDRRVGDYSLESHADPGGVVTRLHDYFAGDLGAIESIDTETGGTPFQRSVWEELRKIPVGRAISYQDLAHAIGKPKAVRAVGTANGRNPIAIIIPCHRVIGRDGSLTGYGGGLDRKQWLLEHEGALPHRVW